jgi:ADP-ribose pyrophosphatase
MNVSAIYSSLFNPNALQISSNQKGKTLLAVACAIFTLGGAAACAKKLCTKQIQKIERKKDQETQTEKTATKSAESATQKLDQETQTEKVVEKADQLALTRYFELLDKHPELKREGKLNDHKQGTYEITYDPHGIENIRKIVYERLLKKNLSEEAASSASRIGVVHEDLFWVWIRDAVCSPSGCLHTYNRLIQQSQLTGKIGAVVLPILQSDAGKKIALLLNFRHATGSWELELPRGAGEAGEAEEEIAKRELEEEMGFKLEGEPRLLGHLAPDSGVLAAVVPIFVGAVQEQVAPKYEQTEAIADTYFFTLEQLDNAMDVGYLDLPIKDGYLRVGIRDSSLLAGLHLAKLKGVFSNKMERSWVNLAEASPSSAL